MDFYRHTGFSLSHVHLHALHCSSFHYYKHTKFIQLNLLFVFVSLSINHFFLVYYVVCTISSTPEFVSIGYIIFSQFRQQQQQQQPPPPHTHKCDGGETRFLFYFLGRLNIIRLYFILLYV